MKKRILLFAAAALLLLSNCMTLFADSQEKDYSVETPAADEPSPYEDAMLEPYRFNNLIAVFQERPYFYAETTAPGRRNPVRAVVAYSDGESYKAEEYDSHSYSFEYDAQGNLVSVSEFFSDGSLWTTEQYTYDAQSNLLSETSFHYWSDSSTTGGTSQYTYDKQGRLLSENHSGCYSTQYTYDVMGNVLTYIWTNGEDPSIFFKDSYTRDARGNVLTHIFKSASGSDKDRHTLTYDAQGRLLTDYVLFSDNPEGWQQSQYTYDEMGNRLTYDYILDAGDGFVYTVQYTYDAMGNVLTHSYYDPWEQRFEDQFTYDAAGNVLTHTNVSTGYWPLFTSIERYTYDEIGNLLSYTIDTEINGSKYWSDSKQYTYDAMGNLLTYTDTYIEHKASDFGGHKPGHIEIEKWQYFYE